MSKINQLRQVYGYVKIVPQDDRSHTALEMCVSFLSFYSNTDQIGTGIYYQIIEIIESKRLSLSECRGQGYDGARNLYWRSEANSQPNALYAAQNLNLVVYDAVGDIKHSSSFFSTLEKLHIIFGHSIRRRDIRRI